MRRFAPCSLVVAGEFKVKQGVVVGGRKRAKAIGLGIRSARIFSEKLRRLYSPLRLASELQLRDGGCALRATERQKAGR